MMKRMLSLWLPRWPINRLAARLSRLPALSPEAEERDQLMNRPFVLVEKQAGGLRLYALNIHAEKAGLYRGMALTDARAMLPGLKVRPAEPVLDAAALTALGHWMRRYCPWVALDGADGLSADISGCAHLFGGETALLEDLSRRLDAMGADHRLAIADTLPAAQAQARFGPAASGVIPPGQTDAFMAGLPVAALALDDAMTALLNRLGLRRIGDVTALPRAALARRFRGHRQAGRDVGGLIARLDAMSGRDAIVLNPLAPPQSWRLRHGWQEPIVTTSPIAAVLPALLKALGRAMEKAGQGPRRLRLEAYRVDGSIAGIEAEASRPNRSVAHWQRLLVPKIERIDPGFGIDLVILAALRSEDLRPMQSDWADEDLATQHELAELRDRLAARLGSEAIQLAQHRQSHRPEKAARWGKSFSAPPKARAHPARPLRLFARPEPIRVMAEVPDHPPLRITWRRRTFRIVRAAGPERLEAEWWRDDDLLPRDYFRLEDEVGRRFWVYRAGLYGDAVSPDWYLHGLFA